MLALVLLVIAACLKSTVEIMKGYFEIISQVAPARLQPYQMVPNVVLMI